jgi:hypothetical protein
MCRNHFSLGILSVAILGMLIPLVGCEFDPEDVEEEGILDVGQVTHAYQYPYVVETRVGPKSGTGDDAPSFVTCASGYTLTGCDCHSPWFSCDGAYTSGSTCVAFNRNGGAGVYAVAQCMRINGIIAATSDRWSARSGGGDDNPTSVACPTNMTLTGCSCYSPWAACDGAKPSVVGGLETCTAYNDGGSGVYAIARCTDLGATYHSYKTGSKSATGDDAASSISCSSGYSLTGCACYSPWDSCDGARASGVDTCTAYNKNGGNGVYAQAICVSIK